MTGGLRSWNFCVFATLLLARSTSLVPQISDQERWTVFKKTSGQFNSGKLHCPEVAGKIAASCWLVWGQAGHFDRPVRSVRLKTPRGRGRPCPAFVMGYAVLPPLMCVGEFALTKETLRFPLFLVWGTWIALQLLHTKGHGKERSPHFGRGVLSVIGLRLHGVGKTPTLLFKGNALSLLWV